jgi:sulfate adenylyltransferase
MITFSFVTILFFTQGYVTAEYAKEKGLTIKNLSGTKFRQMLRNGDEIPTW